jgi:hypothetical protein
MKIKNLKGGFSRDLYGKLECEHCAAESELSGGYNDGFWHDMVLPSMFCPSCGLNRNGDKRTPEVLAAIRAKGVNGI